MEWRQPPPTPYPRGAGALFLSWEDGHWAQASPTGFLCCPVVGFPSFPILIAKGLQGDLYQEKPLALSWVQLPSLCLLKQIDFHWNQHIFLNWIGFHGDNKFLQNNAFLLQHIFVQTNTFWQPDINDQAKAINLPQTMCLLMEGNNFSHTNTFLFESILFFFHPQKSDTLLGGKRESYVPRKAPSLREGSSACEDCLTLTFQSTGAPEVTWSLKHKLFSHCPHTHVVSFW